MKLKLKYLKNKINSHKKLLTTTIILLLLTITLIYKYNYLSVIFNNSKNTNVHEKNVYKISVVDSSILPENISTDTLITKGEYTVYNNLLVDENVTLEVEPGTIINFIGENSSLIINGTLILNGTADERISITNNLYKYYAEAIKVNNTGTFKAKYTDMPNIGDHNSSIKSINNEGTIVLDNVNMTSKSLNYNIYNYGSIDIINSTIPNNILIYQNSIINKLDNNIIGSNIIIPLTNANKDTFKNISNNKDIYGNASQIVLTESPISDIKLSNNNYVIIGNINIPSNTIFEVDAGANIDFGVNKLTVDGKFILNGTADERINISNNITDWNSIFIKVNTSGEFRARYTDMPNIGEHNASVDVVNNEGILSLDNVNISSYSYNYNINNYGTLDIIDTKMSNYAFVNPNSTVNRIENTISRGISISLATANIDTFKNIKNNKDIDDNRANIYLYNNPSNNVKLSNNNYIITENLTIPENVVLEVDDGANIDFGINKLTVDGKFILNGTENNRINISNNIHDWNSIFIKVNSSGEFRARYTDMPNIGEHYASVEVVNNEGVLSLDNVNISSYSYNYNINNLGTLDIVNTKTPNYILVNANSTVNRIENNVSNGIFVSLITSNKDTFKNIKNNKDLEGNDSIIYLGDNPSSDVKLTINKYMFPYNITIPENVVFEVDAGANLDFGVKNITVNGKFILNGTEDNRITISNNIYDWNSIFIKVNSSGVFSAKYTDMPNIGEHNGSISVINNEGLLTLDNVNITSNSNNYILGNYGVIDITNTKLSNYLSIYANSTVNRIENIVSKGIFVSLITSNKDTFKNIKNNKDFEGNDSIIYLDDSPSSDVKLTNNKYAIFYNFTIPENVIFEVDEGANIDFDKYRITVNGTFLLNGSENNRVNITNKSYDRYIDFIKINSTGTFKVQYTDMTNITDPDYSVLGINNDGTLNLDNVNVTTNGYSYGITNYGSIDMTNSNLPGGLYNGEASTVKRLENNTTMYDTTISLYTADKYTFENVKNNKNYEGNASKIYLYGSPVNDIKLLKSNYIITESLTIPENVIFEIEAGTNIDFDKYRITVNGSFISSGTENNRVYMSNKLDESRSTFIKINSTGMFNAVYTEMPNYAGYYTTIEAINNQGILTLDNVNITSSSYNYNLVNYGCIAISNSKTPNSINIYNSSIVYKLENNIIDYNITVPLDIPDINTFTNIKDNKDSYGNPTQIILTGSPVDSVKLSKNNYIINNSLKILKDTAFEVEAGANIRFDRNVLVNVEGLFNLAGTINDPITLTNYYENNDVSYDYWAGIVVQPSGVFISNNSIIKWAGNSYLYPIEVYGQLIMSNSTIKNGYYGRAIYFSTNNDMQALKNNEILGNSTSNIPIDGTYNYWGGDTGPQRQDYNTGEYKGNGYYVNNYIFAEPYNSSFIKTEDESIEFLTTKLYEVRHFGNPGVSISSGNYSKQFIDLDIKNTDLSINRTYNSKNDKAGVLGYGFTFGFSSTIKKNPFDDNSYIAYLPDGSIDLFTNKDNSFVSEYSRNSLIIENDKYILTKTDQTKYTYNNSGNLESITDKYGNITKVITNNNGFVESIIDYANRQYTFEYNNNLLTKIIDPIGRTVTYSYNDNNMLSKVINANGVETNYIYNDKKLLVEIKENNNSIVNIEYTNSNKIYKLTNELGNLITYTYDEASRVTRETDINNRVTQKYYDYDGYTTKIINPDNTETQITYNYVNGTNKYGEELSRTDINFNKTTYNRDELGRITKVINPDYSSKQYVYNSKNSIIMEIDELGRITEYFYADDDVTILKIVKPLDGTKLYSKEEDQSLYEIKTFTYYMPNEVNNIKGLINTKTDETGTTRYEYDEYGNIASITDGNQNKIVYTNNKIGFVLKEQTNNNYITSYEYDNMGNITKVYKNQDLITTNEYNYQNKPTKVIDGNNNALTMEYDKALNIIKSIDKNGNTTSYVYDVYGNVIEKTEPNGAVYIYEYDALNRVTKTFIKTNDNKTLLEEKYYNNSNNYSITTRRYIDNYSYTTKTEVYNYLDKLIIVQDDNHIKSISYLSNGLTSYEIDENGGYTYYNYNSTNRLESTYKMVDNNEFIYTAYSYDNFGRLIEEKVGNEKVILNTIPNTFITTTYTYKNNLLVSKTSSSGENITYEYDAFNNVVLERTKINNDEYFEKKYEYNYLNKVIKQTIGDIETTYTYDLAGNLISEKNGKKTIEYKYDNNSNLTKTTINGIDNEQIFYDNMNNKIKYIDGNGNTTTNTYDLRNNLIKSTNPKELSTIYSYDLLNRLKTEEDPNNTVTSYNYDNYNNIIKKTIGNDIVTTYVYDNKNNLIKTTDSEGYSTYYTYDLLNKVKTLVDSKNNITQYKYDTRLNLIEEINPKNQVTLYNYDEHNNLIKKSIKENIDSNETALEEYTYDLLNNKTKMIDANLNTTVYNYNTNGQLISTTNPLGYKQEYTYNYLGEVIKITDNQNKQIIKEYDNNSNVTKEIEQTINGEEKIELIKFYDNNSNLIKEIDGNGFITTYVYDSLNNLVKKTNPLEQTTSYTYDNNSNLIKETNYLGDSKTYKYDYLNRLIETRNELDEIVSINEYNKNNKQIRKIDANGYVYSYVYDELGNVIQEIDELGNKEVKEYDSLNNLVKKIDKNGNVTMYVYDYYQNLVKVTNPLNEITSYVYDKNNNLLKVIDGRGSVTEYTYDALNNELTEKDGLGNTEYKEYDIKGLLKKKTTRNNDVVEYSYNIHDRLVKEGYITYKYDNNDNLIEINELDKKIVRNYDKINRVILKNEDGLVSSYSYDIDGYKEKTIDPSKNEVIKEYDKVGRLISVNDEVYYTYNKDQTLQKLTYKNGTSEEYFYNKDKTLYKLVNTNNDVVEEYTYEYDFNKNIIKEIIPTKTVINTYDSLNRLKTVSNSDEFTTYNYDKSGNIILEETNDSIKTYEYNLKNQLISITETTGDITTYEYDNNGNLLTTKVNDEVTEANEYNYKNELIKTIDKDKNTTTYEYNSENKRISKTNNDNTTKFIYEGKDIILELDKNNNMLASNTYGLTLVKRTTEGNNGYYIYNGHGDVVGIVDDGNQILNTYEYDVFGVITKEEETINNPYRYSGYYYDSETNNYYLLSRYYNPSIARFISEDTYRGELNDPLSLNRYVYVNNNPLIYYDPDGYFFREISDAFKYLGLRGVAAVQAGGEIACDFVVGTASLAMTELNTIQNFADFGINNIGYQFGLINNKDYINKLNEIETNLKNDYKIYSGIPNGIVNNFSNTFNVDNIKKYWDPNTTDYNFLKNQSKATINTGITLYAGYKLGKSIYNKMNTAPVSNNNNLNTSSNPLSSVKNLKVNTEAISKIGGNYNLIKSSPYYGINGNYNINKIQKSNNGRASNHLKPDLSATGEHTTFYRDPNTGEITRYETWKPNPKNPTGFDTVKRFDLKGISHYNNVIDSPIPTPHIHEKITPGGIRPALPGEIPRNKLK